jgi:hypothetical protein
MIIDYFNSHWPRRIPWPFEANPSLVRRMLYWKLAPLETPLDGGFCRHDEYAHRFPTVIGANAAIQKTTTQRNSLILNKYTQN